MRHIPSLLIIALTGWPVVLCEPLNLVLTGAPIFTPSKTPNQLLLSLTNEGSRPLTLVKDPRGLLTPLPTNVFTFTDDKGSVVLPKFIGVKAKGKGNGNGKNGYRDAVSLKPGESVQVFHDLSKAYDLSALPQGRYTVTGNKVFYQYDSASGKISTINATSESGALHHSFELKRSDMGRRFILDDTDPSSNSTVPSATSTDSITPISTSTDPIVPTSSTSADSSSSTTFQTSPNTTNTDPSSTTTTTTTVQPQPTPTPTPTFINCTSTEQTLLTTAALVAQTYSLSAASNTTSPARSSPRYSHWFGLPSPVRHNLVQAQFTAISGNDFGGFTYDCGCREGDIYAYVYPDRFGYVYLCGAFWEAPMNGTDSKGGTLVHEASHFTQNAGGTEDHAYGQQTCELLALLSPDGAVTNADSHEYFAENNPFLA